MAFHFYNMNQTTVIGHLAFILRESRFSIVYIGNDLNYLFKEVHEHSAIVLLPVDESCYTGDLLGLFRDGCGSEV